MLEKKVKKATFPGGPAVTTLPCNAGDVGLIPGQGTKIPHVVEQLSLGATPQLLRPHNTTRESVHSYQHPRDATKILHATTETT